MDVRTVESTMKAHVRGVVQSFSIFTKETTRLDEFVGLGVLLKKNHLCHGVGPHAKGRS